MVLLLLIFGVLFLFDFDSVFNKAAYRDRPDFVFENIVVSHFNDGVLEAEVKAHHASIDKDSNEIVLRDSKGSFYFEDKSFLTFNATNTNYDLQTRRWQFDLPYMVYVKQKKPLIWFDSKKILVGSDYTTIYSDQLSHFYKNNMSMTTHDFKFKQLEKKMFFSNYSEIKLGGFDEK